MLNAAIFYFGLKETNMVWLLIFSDVSNYNKVSEINKKI